MGRVLADSERERLAAAARDWKGSRAEFARMHGVSNTTASRWLRATPLSRPPERPTSKPPPTMLEVVSPIPVTATLTEPERIPARLALGQGVTLYLESLPPASWVAQLAAGLGRC
jgi:hypothetical protein